MATSSRTPKSSKGGKPARQTQGFEVIAWIETHCILTAARWRGKPFKLLPWQKRMILELFELKPDGTRKHRWAYISIPKKNGKTELMAALALWFMIGSGEPSPLIVCAAGSDDQADLLFSAAKVMADESPTLKQICLTGENVISVPSIPGAELVRVAASARKNSSNLDGKNIFVVICDELHVWEGERGETVWGTLTRGTVAREQPMVVQITTAGFDRTSICWKQYTLAKAVMADPEHDPEFYAYVTEAPAGCDHTDPESYKAANPSYGVVMGWDYYRGQLSKQPENQIRRYYLNQWTRSADSWLPAGSWEACLDAAVVVPPGAEVTVGVDVSLKRDHTAVVLAHRTEDGRYVVRSKAWAPPRDGSGIDIPAVMDYIRELSIMYRVRSVEYDPRFFDVPAKTLYDEGIPMIEVPQSAQRMVPACGWTWEQIVSGNVVHDGDEVLTEHVLAAAQNTTEHGWTLSKNKSRQVIDACIAMVLAIHGWTASEPPSVAPARFVEL